MIPPLMGKKKAVGLILGMKQDAEAKESEGDSLKMVAEDLIRAVGSKDAAAVADAFRAAFNLLESEEHVEMGEEI